MKPRDLVFPHRDRGFESISLRQSQAKSVARAALSRTGIFSFTR
jgi:hypothetical protein